MDLGLWSQPGLRSNTDQYAGGQGRLHTGGRILWAWISLVVSLSAVKAEQYDVQVATVKRRAGVS